VIIAYADGFDFAVVARANGTAGVSGIVFWSRCFCDPDAHQHDFDDAVCSIQERIPDVKILAGRPAIAILERFGRPRPQP
jgi:hypothetical protein